MEFNKTIKKIFRIFLRILLAIIILLVVAYAALQTSSVQTWLAKRVTAYLSDKLHAKVYVDKVTIRFVKSVVLKGLYIEDQHFDTLFYAKELSADISKFSNSKQIIDFKSIKLDHAVFHLIRYKGEQHDNLKFITDCFASTDTTASPKWNIALRNIHLTETHFKHVDENKIHDSIGVDFSNLDLDGINGDLNDLSFVNDSIFVKIDKLKFHDHSGFTVNEFSSDTKISSNEMRFKDLVIKTPATNLHLQLTFNFDSIADFDDFEHKVNIKSNFASSDISPHDIAFFSHDLEGMNFPMKLKGMITGKVDNLKGKKLEISFGAKSKFAGNLFMKGLPNFDETFIELQIADLTTNKKDIESIPLPPFNEKNFVKVPDNIATLGTINFKGNFTGFTRDFVAYGNLNTDIGYVSSDLNFKYDPADKITSYNGHVSANQFQAGTFLSSPDLGNVSFNFDVKGKGLTRDALNATVNGNISSIGYRNYLYKNIKVDGDAAKKLFNGSLIISEPNVDMAFQGSVDFRNDVPVFDCSADINHLHLDTLNLIKLTNEAELQSKLNFHFKGNDLDNLEGTIKIENTNYRNGKKLYHLNEIVLNSEIKGGTKKIELQSDLGEARISGEFDFGSLAGSFEKIIPEYLPALEKKNLRNTSAENFEFAIRFKNISLISSEFLPSWWIEPGTMITGNFYSRKNIVNVSITSPLITYKNSNFNNCALDFHTDSSSLALNIHADDLVMKGGTRVMMPALDATASGNDIRFRLQLANADSFPDRADLKGKFHFNSSQQFSLALDSQGIYIQQQPWIIDARNKIEFDSSFIHFADLNFSNGFQMLAINGYISGDASKDLSLKFSNFDMNILNQFLSQDEISVGGTINGLAQCSAVLNHPKLISHIEISGFSFNKDTIGNTTLITNWDNDIKTIAVNAAIVKGTRKIVDCTGNYFTEKENNNLDFDITLDELYMQTFKRYVKSIFSNMTGKVSAQLHLAGTLEKPLLTGDVNIPRANLFLTYLNMPYTLNAKIKLKENYFELVEGELMDFNFNTAKATGKVYHDHLKNFIFDLRFVPEHLQVLNTNASQNELYFGTAYASGLFLLKGSPEKLKINIAAKSEKGTRLNIPLTEATSVNQGDFVTFVNHKNANEFYSEKYKTDLSGIELNMDFEITTNAEMQIIFDEKIGDKIKGRGTGNIKMIISTLGDFNMYGNYTISNGDYLFTLQNILNKHFTIQNGGTISWSGSPYDADINLTAVYKTPGTSLYDLTLDENYRRSPEVYCRLNLTGKLLNPNVKFDIEIPGMSSDVSNLVRSYINTDAEMSKQIFSLLLLNRFSTPASLQASNAQNPAKLDQSLSSSGSELLTNQISNWLSQLPTSITLGLNYHRGDALSKEEVDVLVKRQYDRFVIDGNIGVASDQTSRNIVGDFNVEYLVTADGRLRVKVFNRSNNNLLTTNNAPYTQGAGVSYREEFDTWKELFTRKKKTETPVVPTPVPEVK